MYLDDRDPESEISGLDEVDLWCMELSFRADRWIEGLVLRPSSCGASLVRVGIFRYYFDHENQSDNASRNLDDESYKICEECGGGFWGSWKEMTIV